MKPFVPPLFLSLLIAPAAVMSDTVLGYTLEYRGNFYSITVNNNGAVLRSGEETVYMGVSCDVATDSGEQGSWSWSNAGFSISLPDRTMTFERHDSPVENDGRCQE